MRQLLCSFLCVVATSALANNAIIGAGGTTCGKWVENRRTDAYYHHQLNWVLGFVSSYNYYLHAGTETYGVIGSTDSASIAVWMDNYCKENPLETVFAGSVQLVTELKARAR